MYSCSIVSDRQGLGAVVQFCTRTIAAQGMVAAVEVFQVPHGVRVDAALRKAAGALGVQAVVQDGQQAGLDGLALFFLCFDALGKAAFLTPTQENRNAAFFMPSCYAVRANKALIYAALRARK